MVGGTDLCSMAGSARLAWFLRSQSASTSTPVNFVDVSVVTAAEGTESARVFGLDVPKDAFDRMMERAAKHPGYSARSVDLHETRTRDSVLSFEVGGGGGNGVPQATRIRVTRSCLVDASVLQGSPLLVRRYQRTPLQLPMFPHSVVPHSSYRARRVMLRIHRNAKLVFESRISDDCVGRQQQQQQRRVRVEVELRPQMGEKELLDLQRTVENTIQVVLLGYRALVGGQSHSTLPKQIE